MKTAPAIIDDLPDKRETTQYCNLTREQFRIGARLSRGRSYACRGQVLSADIRNGVVAAPVQGSRKRPYSGRRIKQYTSR